MTVVTTRAAHRSEGRIVFSVVCLCIRISVCLSVKTREPLEISSRNFQGMVPGSKGKPSSKIAIVGCAGGAKTSLVFSSSRVDLKIVIGI